MTPTYDPTPREDKRDDDRLAAIDDYVTRGPDEGEPSSWPVERDYLVKEYERILETAHRAAVLVTELQEANAKLREALREIEKGEGRFSLDNNQHAINTVEDMKLIATNALLGKPLETE